MDAQSVRLTKGGIVLHEPNTKVIIITLNNAETFLFDMQDITDNATEIVDLLKHPKATCVYAGEAEGFLANMFGDPDGKYWYGNYRVKDTMIDVVKNPNVLDIISSLPQDFDYLLIYKGK